MTRGRMGQFKKMRAILMAGVAVVALSACASNRTSTSQSPDYGGMPQAEAQSNLAQLSARYGANPRDKGAIINFAAALRAAGQTDQAVSVMEKAIGIYPNDFDIQINFAKALAADGRFEQALTIVDGTITPDRPNWNALSVKGAILDQTGQHEMARQLYRQALVIAPQQASLEANLGLSYAMTNDLTEAEAHLRKAQTMRGANSQIQQNLALILGLQGRFDEARQIYSRTLPPEHVEANMAYIRALLTQQDRWQVIKDKG